MFMTRRGSGPQNTLMDHMSPTRCITGPQYFETSLNNSNPKHIYYNKCIRTCIRTRITSGKHVNKKDRIKYKREQGGGRVPKIMSLSALSAHAREEPPPALRPCLPPTPTSSNLLLLSWAVCMGLTFLSRNVHILAHPHVNIHIL